MRRLILALCTALPAMLVLAASASAATTANFTFDHTTEKYRNPATTSPGAYQSGTTPRAACAEMQPNCTWEAQEFTIEPGQENGAFSATITWASADDDWDLFVYKVRKNGTIDESAPVASSAQGGTTEETATLLADPDAPINAGTYRIMIDNWASANQEYEGFVTFEPYVKGNELPIAAIASPEVVAAGTPVRFDGSRSSDVDGSITNYAWDLDGNGSFDTDTGTSPTVERAFPAGRQTVGLRVRDDDGAVAFTTRAIAAVNAGAPGAGARPAGLGEAALPEPVRRLALDVRSRQKRSSVARRGLAATVECPRACSIVAQLRVSPTVARRLGQRSAGTAVIARQSRRLRDRGFARMRLRPARRLSRRMARRATTPATLRIVVAVPGQATRTFSRRVTIVR